MLNLSIGGKTARSKYEPKAVAVDWENLPDASRQFVLLYGLKQYLADGTAGAESQDDFNAGIDGRLAKLVSGDLSRKTGERDAKADSPEGRAFKLAKEAIRARITNARKADPKADINATKEAIDAAAKAWVEKDPKWLKEATRQLEEAKAAASDADTLLADLGIDLT
jgi:predicted lipid-binding transport protein (Tim44 family)